jgi:hypothetical protein
MEFFRQAPRRTTDALDNLFRRFLRRHGYDIGRPAVWLASDYSDYVNRICLYVDSGMTLYPGFETGG